MNVKSACWPQDLSLGNSGEERHDCAYIVILESWQPTSFCPEEGEARACGDLALS